MRYADFAPPSTYTRDPRPCEAALVVRSEHASDLLALLAERSDLVLIERAQPGPDLPVMHYVQCVSALEAKRLERSWNEHQFQRWMRKDPRFIETCDGIATANPQNV